MSFWHSLIPCNNQVHSSGHCYFPIFLLFHLSLLSSSLSWQYQEWLHTIANSHQGTGVHLLKGDQIT